MCLLWIVHDFDICTFWTAYTMDPLNWVRCAQKEVNFMGGFLQQMWHLAYCSICIERHYPIQKTPCNYNGIPVRYGAKTPLCPPKEQLLFRVWCTIYCYIKTLLKSNFISESIKGFYWFSLIAVAHWLMGHCITEPTTWPNHFSCHRVVVYTLFL